MTTRGIWYGVGGVGHTGGETMTKNPRSTARSLRIGKGGVPAKGGGEKVRAGSSVKGGNQSINGTAHVVTVLREGSGGWG